MRKREFGVGDSGIGWGDVSAVCGTEFEGDLGGRGEWNSKDICERKTIWDWKKIL